jgi:hypothetical protein
MKLYTLLHGKSKKRMKPIMVDELHKCENYMNAREKSGVGGWHNIVPAESDAVIWRQKSATIGGNKCTSVPRIGRGLAGYISKNGFEPHT